MGGAHVAGRFARLGATALALVAASACSRTAPPSERAASDASAAPPVASAPASAPSHAALDVANVFRGTIDGKHAIVVRLARTGDEVKGTYWYEPTVRDLALRGTIAESGAVHLDELVANKRTGSFEGKVAADGSIDGTWTDAKATRHFPFHLDPLRPAPSPAHANVVRRIVQSTQKSKSAAPDGVCKIDVAFPEIVGTLDPIREAAVNALLRPVDPPEPQPTCDEPFDRGEDYTVRMNDRGVLSVSGSTSSMSFGAAHPLYGMFFVNVSLATGKAIALGDVLAPNSDAKLAAALKPQLDAMDDADTRALVADALTPANADFDIEPEGLRLFAFNALPHAYKGISSEGWLVPWAKLEGALAPSSPLAALWTKK